MAFGNGLKSVEYAISWTQRNDLGNLINCIDIKEHVNCQAILLLVQFLLYSEYKSLFPQ